MDSLKTLLNQDLSKNKPKRIGLTDKFLKWNRAQIKLGKTNYYYDKTKVYNLDTNRVNNISKFIDKRNNKLKKSFLNNYNQYQSTISKKDKNILKFRYEIPNDNINNSSLLHDLITDNNIQGKYRLIIKINDNKLIDLESLQRHFAVFYGGNSLQRQNQLLLWDILFESLVLSLIPEFHFH